MAETMNFPNDWAEFLEDYSFRDHKEFYTNGARLIPTFRVKQMMEHYLRKAVTDKNVGCKWIPVTERLPEEEGWYLVYTTPNREHKSINKAMFCKGYAWSNGEPYWRGAGGHWANVTHWMPLPEPPKGE